MVISQEGDKLKIVDTTTRYYNLDDIAFSHNGITLTIFVNDYVKENIKYSDVTSPTSTDLDDLLNTLNAYSFTSPVLNREFKYEVAMGRVVDSYTINKFGHNEDIDAASGEEIIADWGGNFDPNTDVMSTAQTFTVTYNNTTEGVGQTGARMLLVSYLDENFNLAEGYHTLGSTGSDTTSFTGLGINRVVVISNGGTGWNINDITLTATTDGTTQARIPALLSVTQQCIYHTPIGHNFLIEFIYKNILKTAGGQTPKVSIKGYSWSRVTNTRYEIYHQNIDTAVENTQYITLAQPLVTGGREVIYFTGDTDKDNTDVEMRFSGILEKV